MTPSALAPKADTTRPRQSRNRKDVLGLVGTGDVVQPNLLQSLQKLARAGFRVHQAAPAHWIIRGSTPLPEFHCYGEQELRQFTVNKT
ncbi:MAG: hypothetical protein HLUCCX14_13455 [Marinobacter excellens HL-55]|uniref:Uncharacterized protein n=1 Tax=Marinobacter excellens HL-55 TaxID=1305731 RepID=A0A0P7ZEP2_9GAMM|nr:MAG: hypothetical protein HLUCCX14_13455 [Marinobacter excellens HL-55]